MIFWNGRGNFQMEAFDKIIDRRNTDSLKYDYAVRRGKPADILPLWVADMDFAAPQAVLDALRERVEHGVFGYSDAAGDDYFEALRVWNEHRFGWSVRPEWLIKTPGVVFAICAAIRALTNEGDTVLIQQPVYYPFEEAVRDNHRRLVVNPLVCEDGRYRMNLTEFEELVVRHSIKLFVLCSPHNPVGRVWTREELLAVGMICRKHGVVVVSDEIHADFVYEGSRHLVFASLSEEFADQTITCTAPTKTFNLAGLQISNIWIANERLREQISAEIARTGYSQPNVMGLIACRTAYEQGGEWLDSLRAYLAENLSLLRRFLGGKLPEIRLIEPEGTYLVWLDCRALGMPDRQLDEWMAQKAGLWLDGGTMFGAGGSGFQRMNIACPRETLCKALARLEQAVREERNPNAETAD